MDPIIKKAQEAIKKVAEGAGFVAVFDTSIPSMVYYNETQMTDLMANVKKELGITAQN